MLRKLVQLIFGSASVRSAKAVSMFHKAVNALEKINEEASQEEERIAHEINKLETKSAHLTQVRSNNIRVITKIRSILD